MDKEIDYFTWKVVIIMSIIAAIIVASTICFLVWKDKQNYNKTLENPPSINYLEEDLEEYLFSTALDVQRVQIFISNKSAVLYGNVYVMGRDKYYRFAYALVKKQGYLIPNYKWEFVRYAEISADETQYDLNS